MFIDILNSIKENITLLISFFALIISISSLNEMRKARLAQFRPFLSIRSIKKDSGKNIFDQDNSYSIKSFLTYDNIQHCKLSRIKYPLKLMVRNVGMGPALHIKLDSFEKFGFYFEEEKESNWISLSPNETAIFKLYIYYAGDLDEFIKSVNGTSFLVKFKHNDTSKNLYYTEAKIEISNIFTHNEYPNLEFYIQERLPQRSSIKNNLLNKFIY